MAAENETEQDQLDRAFPDRILAIRRWRGSDPVLDEICRDFEILSGELARLAADGDAASESLRNNIRESLDGLAAEIRTRVAPDRQRSGGEPADDRSPSTCHSRQTNTKENR